MAPPQGFLEQVKSTVLIADGAMGTMLAHLGARNPVQNNLLNPDAVASVHCAYVEAGADIVLTNTFYANLYALEREGLSGQAEDFWRAGVRIARQAAGDRAFVAADLGPTGALLEPYGDLAVADAKQSFARQMQVQLEASPDLILIETMTAVEEAEAAVQAARALCDLPVICTMSFQESGRTMMGVTPTQAAERLAAAGADVVGANCSTGPEAMEPVLRAMREHTGVPLAAKPNAGMPMLEDGKTVYKATPATMAEYAVRFSELGVRVIGGCCGTTPEHIRAMADALGRGTSGSAAGERSRGSA